MTATDQQVDPFAAGTSTPSVSFKDMPVGTSYTGTVLEVPKLVQARNYETGNPDFWPDGNPKMTVVTKLQINGEERSLWAPKPSSMFAAIAAAQQAAGATIAVGGTLTVTHTHDKPNENPRLNPAKQYAVTYEPPNAFAATEQGSVNTTTGEITPPAPASSSPTPEQLAAVKAAGLDPAAVFPGYAG